MCYEALREHPDVCMSTIKETDYYSREYDRGMSWYRKFFRHCLGASAVGEISNSYFSSKEAPWRIAEMLASVKIVTVLRDPFDRIHSAYGYLQKNGTIRPSTPMQQALEKHPQLITDSLYGDCVSRYLRCFPRSNVRIMFYDDLAHTPLRFIQSLFAFIGVDEGFRPRAIHERFNPSVSARFPWLGSLAYSIADFLHRRQLHQPLRWMRKSQAARHLLFEPVGEQGKDAQSSSVQEANEILANRLIPQIKEIERITGKDLSAWYSGRI
jgi:hypothetical protein